jgi:antitoxin CptB
MNGRHEQPTRPKSGAAARAYWKIRLTDPFESADAVRRRRLTFRAWHRGMREVDLLLGRFADASVPAMDEAGLAAFEAILDVPDREILAWIIGEAEVPPEYDTPFVRQLIAFHA